MCHPLPFFHITLPLNIHIGLMEGKCKTASVPMRTACFWILFLALVGNHFLLAERIVCYLSTDTVGWFNQACVRVFGPQLLSFQRLLWDLKK